MSLILDALKKLDREKSFRRSGAANIAVEILRPDLPRPGKRIRVYFVAVSLTAVASAVITYAVMVEFGFLSKSSPPVAVNPPAPSQQIESAPLPREPVRDARYETSPVPPKVKDPAERKKPAEVEIPAEVKTPVESKSPAVSLGEKKISLDVIPEEAEVAPRNIKKPVEHTPSVSATTPPSLRLSGIVWSEEPSSRLVVINGMIATEGSVIAGVKVVEIHPDHVLLSRDGQPFELFVFK